MSQSPILVEVSIGELFDKISILEIKTERISDSGKLKNVKTEFEALSSVAETLPQNKKIAELRKELRKVNEQLWEIEDEIRRCEARSDFSETFIELARSVYITNDKRADLKREINEIAGSRLIEEKDYSRNDS
ncbi:MAG: DUF6165 family protein [Verrucomicrobiales bacterium]|nr:DUF6165 family protein [Verrucomicrobiales bacterium]